MGTYRVLEAERMNRSRNSRVTASGPPPLRVGSGQAFFPDPARIPDRPGYRTLNAGPAAGCPRLIIRTCKHILESGAVCQAAALGGRAYCRAHLQLGVLRGKMARARRRGGILKLPLLVDLQAVEAGMARVRTAQDGGHVGEVRARLLRYGMRQFAADLRFMANESAASPSPDPGTSANRGLQGGKVSKRKSKQDYQIPISPSTP